MECFLNCSVASVFMGNLVKPLIKSPLLNLSFCKARCIKI